MKRANLKVKTMRALSWGMLESLGVHVVRFCIGVLLARLLFPEQFGLIGMLWIFIAVAQSFTDSGYGLALIQKKEVTPVDTSTIFYFNIAVGLAATGVVCSVAPWIAAFYNQPILTPLTRAMSLVIFINSFSIIHSNMLHKHMDFKMLTKVSMGENLLAGVIGVAMAVAGFGVWSLVAQQVSAAFFRTLFLWLLYAWRPLRTFSMESLKQLFGFGSRMLASGLIDQIFSNIYFVVIGKLFSAADLGYYTRAKSIQELPANTVSGLFARVTFPLFSRLQDDPVGLKRGMRKSLSLLMMVNLPMMFGLAVIAEPLIHVMLTEKWAECIPYLELLCFYGLLHPVNLLNLNLLLSLGRSELYLRLEIIKKVLIVICVATTWPWGIPAMIYGLILFSVVSCYLSSYYTGELIGYPLQEQLRDILPYFIISGLMGIVIYALDFLPFPNHWSMLLVNVVTGVSVYTGLCLLFRLEAFMELWTVCCNKIALLRTRTAG
jgi:O-antigen/teichoic acid export membrane protein